MKLFFDHIPKTAGTSLRTFLEEAFGVGMVSPLLSYLKLDHALTLYKQEKILWGHFDFIPGQTLPAGYISATMLREPAERTLSDFFFSKFDVFPFQRDAKLNELSIAEAFSDQQILFSYSNTQSVHFARFYHPNPRNLSANELLRLAKKGLEQYDLVGTTERIAEFCDELRRIFNLPKDVMLKKLEVTSRRPIFSDLPQNIQKKIQEITHIDKQLWEYANELFETKTKRFFFTEKDLSLLPAKENNTFAAVTPVVEDDAIELLGVRVRGHPNPYRCRLLSGEEIVITITFRCHKDVDDLTIGYSIHHDSGLHIFGVNTRLMGYNLKCKAGNDFQVKFAFPGNLGIGKYYVHVSAHTGLTHLERCFFWREKAAFFQIVGCLGIPFEGLVRLMPVCHIGDELIIKDTETQANGFKIVGLNNPPLTDIKGSIRALTPIPPVLPGQQFSILVEITNDGKEEWFFGTEPIRPVHISYHWLDKNENIVIWDGHRTYLSGSLPQGAKIRANAFVEAPKQEGEFILELTLVQEAVCWFDQKGFKTCRLNCRVTR
ncbi:MAG: Wzt carbohydrate-binding domain-containing protein [Desulfosoma sp.]